jgi:hypothetical protein
MSTERKIWKYRFEDGGTAVEIPGGSAVLHVAEQGYGICVWAAVPVVPEGPPIRVILVATGDDEPPPNFTHVATVVNVGGWAVLHAYMELR